jgi:hypothetical protein
MVKMLIFFVLFVQLFSWSELRKISLSREKCMNRIYKECTHKCEFTDEEIDNARKYIQERFASTNPIKGKCSKLRVRKNIKCLTKQEFDDFVDVFKQLNAKGIVDKFTKIHSENWPAVHKFEEGLAWHTWFINKFEQEMHKINPNVNMPYWEYMNEFAHPEKSIIWKLFVHSGKKKNDYCVTDGPFANQQVNYPEPH